VTGAAGHCSFCGATHGPFATVEGLFTVQICIPCLEVRQAQPDTRLGLHDPGTYPPMTPAEMRESPGVCVLLGRRHPINVRLGDQGRCAAW
jgi:hypothetical protein